MDPDAAADVSAKRETIEVKTGVGGVNQLSLISHIEYMIYSQTVILQLSSHHSTLYVVLTVYTV